jgi:hypothetical protein
MLWMYISEGGEFAEEDQSLEFKWKEFIASFLIRIDMKYGVPC